MENKGNTGAENDSLQGKDIKMVHAKLSDAASDNEREAERIQEADKAAKPSYELHTQNEGRLKTDEDSPSGQDDIEDNSQLASSQPADADETVKFGEEIGGITNLTLEQLKKEGGPSGEEDRDAR